MPELSILAAFAHPDDETILAGGTLAMLASRGSSVHLMLATRGEGGELGEPPRCERSELATVREAELRCAADQLGVTSSLFLEYIDPLVGDDEELYPFDCDFETLSQELGAALIAVQADVLITHGSNGEYGHPAHMLMHRACLLALQASKGTHLPLYTISADFATHPRPRLANKDDPAHFILDINPWFEKKVRAAECHQTQAALFVRRSSLEAGRRLELSEVIMPTESLHRAWPSFATDPDDAFAHFLRSRCSDAIIFDQRDAGDVMVKTG